MRRKVGALRVIKLKDEYFLYAKNIKVNLESLMHKVRWKYIHECDSVI